METLTSPTLLDAPDFMREAIAEACPSLRAMLDQVIGEIPTFVVYAHHTAGEERTAVSAIVTQASNTFVDVMFDISAGRGRSAAMGTRSLFELLVTLREVIGSSSLADRYLAHGSVSAQIEAQLSIGVTELRGNSRRALAHRRKKLGRDTEEAYNEAVQRYGRSFARSWARGDLRTRAVRLGLEEDYEYFRLVSSVLHGSAGGSMGLIADVGGQLMHRQGPALYLCPLAYLEALRLFQGVVEACGREIGGPSTTQLARRLRAAQSLYAEYEAAVERIDRDLWPTGPVPGLVSILAILPLTMKETWYLFEPITCLVCPAYGPIGLTSKQAAGIELVREQIRREVSMATHLITVAMQGVTVTPIPDAKWQHAATVLVQEPFGGWKGSITPDNPVMLGPRSARREV